MTFWHRRRFLNAAWLTVFSALAGVGLALCTNEDRRWVWVVGGVMVVIGVGGLLLYSLAGPGGW